MNLNKMTTTNKILLYIIGALVVFLFISTKSCVNSKDSNEILEQNLIAAQDTIRMHVLKNDNLLAEKNAFILNEQELERQLGIAKNEIKELKSKLGSGFTTITKIESKIEYDTISIPGDTVIINNGQRLVKFSYSDDWLSLSGETCVDSIYRTKLYNINIPVDLVVGTTKENKIFVETKNPYLYINNITGAVLQDTRKKSHWGFGLGIGVGAQYGIINKKIDIGPQVMCGVMYKF